MVKAQDVFKRMTERGIYPDVVAYNTLIKGYVVNNDAKNAFKAFNNVSVFLAVSHFNKSGSTIAD